MISHQLLWPALPMCSLLGTLCPQQWPDEESCGEFEE